MSITGLCISGVKTYIGISASDTSQDSALDEILTGVEADCELFTDRTYHEETIDETYSPRYSSSRLYLRKYPIISVAGLTDDYGNSNTTVQSFEYFFTHDHEFGPGAIQLNTTGTSTTVTTFTPGIKKVAITYTAGYTPAAPTALLKSCYKAAGWEFKRRGKIGTSSVSLGDWSVSYSPDTEIGVSGYPIRGIENVWMMFKSSWFTGGLG